MSKSGHEAKNNGEIIGLTHKAGQRGWWDRHELEGIPKVEQPRTACDRQIHAWVAWVVVGER